MKKEQIKTDHASGENQLIEKIIVDAQEGRVKSTQKANVNDEEKQELYDSIDSKIGPLSTGVACG